MLLYTLSIFKMRQSFRRLLQEPAKDTSGNIIASILGIGFLTGSSLTTYHNGKAALLEKRDKLKNVTMYSDDYKRALEMEAVLHSCVVDLPISFCGGFLFPVVIAQHAVLFLNPKKD